MNDPFIVIPPTGRRVPLVLDSPHSGSEYPDDFGCAVPGEALRQAEDSHVNELFGGAPGLGAALIAARFPRSYIDPNRSLLDIDATLLDAPWPGPALPSRKTELGVGLICPVLHSADPTSPRNPSFEQVNR